MSSFIALDALNPVFHGWVIIIMVQSSGVIKGRPGGACPPLKFELPNKKNMIFELPVLMSGPHLAPPHEYFVPATPLVQRYRCNSYVDRSDVHLLMSNTLALGKMSSAQC